MNIKDFKDIHHHGPVAPGLEDTTIVNLPLQDTPSIPATGYYSIGLHPWDTAHFTPQLMERLRALASAPNVIAIGEAGIDALRGGDTALQREAFTSQARIAEEVGKPLIIHAVRTLGDIIALHRQIRPRQQWIVHGFRGKPQLAAQLVREGIALSFGRRHNPDSLLATPPAMRYTESDEDPTIATF